MGFGGAVMVLVMLKISLEWCCGMDVVLERYIDDSKGGRSRPQAQPWLSRQRQDVITFLATLTPGLPLLLV